MRRRASVSARFSFAASALLVAGIAASGCGDADTAPGQRGGAGPGGSGGSSGNSTNPSRGGNGGSGGSGATGAGTSGTSGASPIGGTGAGPNGGNAGSSDGGRGDGGDTAGVGGESDGGDSGAGEGGAGNGGVGGDGGASPCMGSPFAYETIEMATVYGATIAVDSAGRPHVAYTADVSGPLHYAVRNASGWEIETVAPDARVFGAEVVLDSTDRPCLAYGSTSNTVRVVCRRGREDWVERFSRSANGRFAVALDSTDTAHVVWSFGSSIVYAKEGSTAEPLPLVPSGLGPRMAIALDSNNVVHVLVSDGDVLSLSTGTGATFTSTPLVTAGPVETIGECDLAIDENDGVHLAFANPSHANTYLGYRGPGDANFASANEQVAAGEVKIAFHPQHGPHIAYRVAALGSAAVKIAHRCDDVFVPEFVEIANGFPDLAFAADGTLHVLYVEALSTSSATPRRLRYAVR